MSTSDDHADTQAQARGASRRTVLGGAVLGGAVLGGAAGLGLVAGTPGIATALAASPTQSPAPAEPPILRAFPRTGERVPAIGLGTFLTFDLIPGQPRDHLRAVMETVWQAGGRLIDTSPLYGMGEVNVGAFKAALGIDEGLFITNKIWSTGEFLADDSHARHSLETSRQRLWRDTIDALQCHSLVNVEVAVPLMTAWKREGLIRYVGATHHDPAYFGVLADWVEKGGLDMVQVHYSILERRAEDRILPAAAAKGTAVLVNMPFEKARLFTLVEGRPLPDFAAEFGARTWAEFFLKWVIAHPAVTCAIPATSNPEHAAQNMAALRGPLPDQAMRARMVQHMETIPGFAELSRTPWYPGKRYNGVIARAQGALKTRG